MKNKQAFTLVELIVVITILAILWTIAFISLQWYARDARDSVRVADLKSIEKWLEFLLLTDSKLPKPESSINIVASGTTIYYQWYAWETVLWKISVHGKAKDPLDDIHYTYMTDTNLRNYQLLWFSEWSDVLAYNKNILNQTNAADYSERYWIVRWKELWIITDANNTPVQDIETTEIVLDWTNSWTLYRAHINNWKTYSFSWHVLTHKLYTLSKPSIYWPPRDCPDWFIPSWWDSYFNQLWFCVAQYEMSYEDADTANSCNTQYPDACINSEYWSTVRYIHWKTIVSQTWKYPIANITQSQAIFACESMWEWYHLITNNEWMAVARNIELEKENWSWSNVWEWNLYNWVSSDTTLGCYLNWWNDESRIYGTKTWAWEATCNLRRKHILSNWQYIWDLSWNVEEHVNWANTLDWSSYDTMNANPCWTLWTNSRNRYSYTNWIWDTNLQCEFINGYTYSGLWPIIPNLNISNGIWRVYSYKDNNTTVNRVFNRGGSLSSSSAGIYGLNLSNYSLSQYAFLGFRCAYIKQ